MTVLDSSALLAYLRGEEKGEWVKELLGEQSSEEILMSVVNWMEVLYILGRELGWEETVSRLVSVRGSLLTLVEVDERTAELAAKFKIGGKIALADCFAAALANIRDAVLVTADKEFKQFEKQIKIKWLEGG